MVEEVIDEKNIEKLKHYKHLILDMDGTLIKLKIDWEDGVNRLEKKLKEINKYVDLNSAWEITNKYIDIYLKHKKEFDKIFEQIEKEYVIKKNGWKKINLYLWEFIEREKPEFSIASNNTHKTIEYICGKTGLLPLSIVGRDDVKKPKPFEDQLKKIIEDFKLNLNEVAFIGDSKYDKIAANRVGVKFYFVKGGHFE